MILMLMEQENLTDSLRIAEALARRSDPYVGDILEALASGANGPSGYLDELRLRMVLAGFFSSGDFLRGRIELARLRPNAAVVSALVERLQGFGDPLLKVELLRLSVDADPTGAAKAAAREGRDLLERMRRGRGELASERLAEALAFLTVVARLGDPVLIDETETLIAVSRDRRFVREARAVVDAAVKTGASSRAGL